ncbi:MAG: ZIP family metal transporter, partial [Actinomycetota bacterium]
MATETRRLPAVPRWVEWLLPVVLIALLVGVFIALKPLGSLRAVPPVEAIAFERVQFNEGSIELNLRND